MDQVLRADTQAISLEPSTPGDGEKPHWIIPRHRTKNKKSEHTVPLSPTAVPLFEPHWK